MTQNSTADGVMARSVSDEAIQHRHSGLAPSIGPRFARTGWRAPEWRLVRAACLIFPAFACFGPPDSFCSPDRDSKFPQKVECEGLTNQRQKPLNYHS